MDFGSSGPLRIEAKTSRDAQLIQDEAAEHCSMPYRAPELFHVSTGDIIDQSIDIWVRKYTVQVCTRMLPHCITKLITKANSFDCKY